MVHFRISLEGKPVPCWISIRDHKGTPIIPLGWNPSPLVGGECPAQHLVNNEIYCASNGGFEIPIQPGIHSVHVLAKPGIAAWKGQIEILVGQLAVRIALTKAPSEPLGWFAVDLRTHGLSPKAALLEAEASGMNLVQMLAAAHWPETSPPKEPNYAQLVEFSGTQAALESSRSSIIVNTLNRHPDLGSVSLLHSHRPIYPWFSGWKKNETPWSIQDWCHQCHRIKGVVIWPELDPQLPEYEALAGVVNGDIDGIELCASLGKSVLTPESRLNRIYSLWTAGIACGIVGSSGKCNNQIRLGQSFTWIKIGDSALPTIGLPLDRIMALIKKGKGTASNGPLLGLGKGPGVAQAFVDFIGPNTLLEWISEEGVIGSQPLEPGLFQTISMETLSIKNWLSCRIVDNNGSLLAHSSMIQGPDFGQTGGIWDNQILKKTLRQGLEWNQENGNTQGPSLQNQLANYLQKALNLMESNPANRKQ